MKRAAVCVSIVIVFIALNLYAGDLTVTGKLGVGADPQQERLFVNGNIGSNNPGNRIYLRSNANDASRNTNFNPKLFYEGIISGNGDGSGGTLEWGLHLNALPWSWGQDKIYYHGADHIFYTTEGAGSESEKVRIMQNGNLGIGTTSPVTRFEVAPPYPSAGNVAAGVFRLNGNQSWGHAVTLATDNPTGDDARLLLSYRNKAKQWALGGFYNSTRFGIWEDAGDGVYGSGWGTERFTISAGGNVGIGKADPGAKLDVVGDIWSNSNRPIKVSGIQGKITIQGDTGGWANYLHFLGSSGTDRGGFGALGGADALAYLYAGDSYSNPTTVWRSGNVGIGTTEPASKLHIISEEIGTGANKGFRISNYNNSQSYSLRTGITNVTNNSLSVYDENAGANRLVVDTSGNVGIGTTTPNSKLSVGGDGYSAAAIYGYGSYGISGWGTNTGVEGGSTVPGGKGVVGLGDLDGVEGYSTRTTAGGRGVFGFAYNGYDFYAGGPGINYGPFTGGHEVKLSDDTPKNLKAGMIFSVTGELEARSDDKGNISISSTLPTVALSNIANDKAVFGVLVMEADVPEKHWHKKKEGERFAAVNALGEGRVLVTNINGDIDVGDYITTSPVPGYGQKQNDDLLHSYTLGKAIEKVDWSKVTETAVFNGKKYKVYLIGVVYTSG